MTQQTDHNPAHPLACPPTAPAAAVSTTEDIFLTPRVIDRRTFENYASSLRQSLEETSRESDLLARRAEAAAVVLERLERFVGSHSDVFDRAGQLIESIDERQESTGELLGQLARITESAKQASHNIESLIKERSEAFESRLVTVASAALDRFEETSDTLSKDAARLRRDLTERLDLIRGRGEAVVGALEERATNAGEALASTLTEVDTLRDSLRTEARDAARRLDEKAAEIRDTIIGEGTSLKRELDAATRALREAIAAGSAHRDTIERSAELAIGRAQAGVGEQALELERLTRRAEAVVREHRDALGSCDAEIHARVLSAQDAVASNLKDQVKAAELRAKSLAGELAEQVSRAESRINPQAFDEIVTRGESAMHSSNSHIQRLEEANTQAISDSEQARLSLTQAAEDVRGHAAELMQRASNIGQESVEHLDRLNESLDHAESWTQTIDTRCKALDEQVSQRVRLTMQEQSLAMAEQISVLNDRLERSEARETVLRGVAEAQSKDISSLQEMVSSLIVNSKMVKTNEEPEPLIPVVRKPVPRKTTPRKKSPTKAASKKTTKKPAVKKTASKKATTKKATRKKKSAAA